MAQHDSGPASVLGGIDSADSVDLDSLPSRHIRVDAIHHFDGAARGTTQVGNNYYLFFYTRAPALKID